MRQATAPGADSCGRARDMIEPAARLLYAPHLADQHP